MTVRDLEAKSKKKLGNVYRLIIRFQRPSAVKS